MGHLHELRADPDVRGLFARAALTALGRRGGELPADEYLRADLRVDPDHLARYSRVCGFRLTGALPLTYPHVLAFPLQLALMTGRDFPFPLPGLVHVANRISQRRPLSADEPLTLRVHARDLRPHPRGQQFDVISEVTAAGEPVWSDTSTYLRRGRPSGAVPATEPVEPDLDPDQASAQWRIPDDIGRRYGEVSGDQNPIHLHPLTARLFGFKRAIAHGMWTKAHALAALEGRLPDACTADVRFKLPVLLPARADFRTRQTPDGWRFTLADSRSGKPHLAGEVTAG